ADGSRGSRPRGTGSGDHPALDPGRPAAVPPRRPAPPRRPGRPRPARRPDPRTAARGLGADDLGGAPARLDGPRPALAGRAVV
ncbi:MAG: hypothetical protein AVDCRST_MAG79-1742, partial [uncultured Thermoleophilia bacterium]